MGKDLKRADLMGGKGLKISGGKGLRGEKISGGKGDLNRGKDLGEEKREDLTGG